MPWKLKGVCRWLEIRNIVSSSPGHHLAPPITPSRTQNALLQLSLFLTLSLSLGSRTVTQKARLGALSNHTVIVGAGPGQDQHLATVLCWDPSSPQTSMSVSAFLEFACQALARTYSAPSAASVPPASRSRMAIVLVSVWSHLPTWSKEAYLGFCPLDTIWGRDDSGDRCT